MAKIKLRFGENEIEVESRDFYVDNETLGQVIANVSRHIQENKAQIVFDEQPTSYFSEKSNNYESSTVLDSLEEAEVHEPEFIDTTNVKELAPCEITKKLKILEKYSFFDSPRTATETVEQLREYGWSAGTFEVAKALTNMALSNEILKDQSENRNYFSTKHAVIVS